MLSGPTIFKQHCLADVTFIKVSMKIIKNLKTSFEKKRQILSLYFNEEISNELNPRTNLIFSVSVKVYLTI